MVLGSLTEPKRHLHQAQTSSLSSAVLIAKPKRHLYQAKTSSSSNLNFSFRFAGVDPALLDLLREDYEIHTNAPYDVLALGPADVNRLLTEAECQREDLRFDSVALEDAEQVGDSHKHTVAYLAF
jgi:hypothetical protein